MNQIYAVIRANLITLLLLSLLSCKKKADDVPMTTNQPVVTFVYSFDTSTVWRDEFDYTGLPDASKWGYDVGGDGWGNQELEYYTEADTANARVENGHLVIEARKEVYQGKDYTSARLVTKGKGDWLYGRVEVRAKLPTGRGVWPAIWMLASKSTYGTDYWPDNGEIDIMEHVGWEPGTVHATIHCKNNYGANGKGATFSLPTLADDFHVYATEWTPNGLDFFVDGAKYFSYPGQTGWQGWPFDENFHLLLNIAVGGSWGGAKGVDESIWPQKMEVDYVRVYPMKKQ